MSEAPKVLLAEDETVARRILVKETTALGLVGIQCSNGERAWSVLDDNPDVALLVTDVIMPELDGRELIQRVRADSRFEKLPILACSGVIKLEEGQELLELGATRFMLKPIKTEEFREYATSLVRKYFKLKA